ncbi:MAG: methionine adenosyltransferase domain-containing protein [Desulfobacterales bacterium]
MVDGDLLLYQSHGKFVIGGPMGSCGLTGRKIVWILTAGQGSHGAVVFPAKTRQK